MATEVESKLCNRDCVQMCAYRTNDGRCQMKVANEARKVDEKGRVVVEELADSEILVEILTRMRLVSDLLEEIGNHPMLSRMIPGLPAQNGKKG